MTPIEKLIGRRFVIGFHGYEAPDYICEWLQEERIGGIILFARNVQNSEQLAELTRTLHAASPRPILVGIDQEGGTIARLRAIDGFTESPGAMALASSQKAEEQIQQMSHILADEMRAMGINWTFAPVLDVSYNAQNPTVGTRSFGREPQRVAILGAQAVKGFQNGGVMACGKHFPGLGNTSIDSHLDLPVLETLVKPLIKNDLLPYLYAIQADIGSIMSTHTIFKILDSKYPTTLSSATIQGLIRDKLNYNGLVVTDCMEMHAIAHHYGVEEASVLAFLAGIDLVLVSHTRETQQSTFEKVIEAYHSGRISEENLQQSHDRMVSALERYAINPETINPQQVGTPDHQQQALQITRSTIALKGDLPDLKGKRCAIVEFSAYTQSNLMEKRKAEKASSLEKSARDLLPHMAYELVHARKPTDKQIQNIQNMITDIDTLVLVTRNAHINQEQEALARDLLAQVDHTVLVALRNPYDADILEADATLFSFGDSVPSIQAVIEVLRGDYPPRGKRPVAAEV